MYIIIISFDLLYDLLSAAKIKHMKIKSPKHMRYLTWEKHSKCHSEDIDSTASSSFVLDIQLAVKGEALLLSYLVAVDIYESGRSPVSRNIPKYFARTPEIPAFPCVCV